MTTAVLYRPRSLTPAAALAVSAGALDRKALAVVVAPLEGDDVLVLGRHQRARTVLRDVDRARSAPRRRTGGVCLTLGAGRIYVAIAAPRWDAIWPETTPKTVSSRFVRPILRGLSLFGPAARFSGLDWISSAHRPVAWVGWEIAPSDATLFEAVVAVRAPLLPSADLLGYPKRAEDPFREAAPSTLGEVGALRGAEDVADRIARGIAEAFPIPLEPGEVQRGPTETGGDDPPLSWGPPREDAIGFVEAGVALDAGRISRARLSGDFYADSGGIAALERSLQGQPPESPALMRAIDQVLGGDRHVVEGLRQRTAILGAFLWAAEKAKG